MIATEEDYKVAGSTTGFIDPGEYGPLSCGCCLVSLLFDPCGPRLLLVMALKSGVCTATYHDLSEWGL